MAVRESAQKLFAWGSEHGTFFFGSVTLVAGMVGGAIAAKGYADQLKLHDEQLKMQIHQQNRDLEHERELRKEVEKRFELHTKEVEKRFELHTKEVKKRFEQRTDLAVKNQLFDILHHSDYEAATRLLHGSQASPAARSSTN